MNEPVIDINGHVDLDLRPTDKTLFEYESRHGEVARVIELQRQGCGDEKLFTIGDQREFVRKAREIL